MKKNILIASNTLCIGGIEKSLINLLKIIDYKKYNVDLFLEKVEGELLNEVPKNVNIIEYKPYKLKIKIIQKALNYLKQKRYKILLKNTYDTSICYATYSYPANFLTRISSNNKILFIHSDYTKILSTKELRNFYDTRYIETYNKIVFVSKEIRDNLIKYYKNIVDKSIVINNIIDIEDIKYKAKLEQIKYDKNNINLLFVGRLEEKSKNLLFLLEQINILRNKYKNIKLYIVGDGLDKKLYENYIKNNNLEKHIKLLGQKNNPYPYIKACDYLILTSNYEGYPVIFTESICLNKDIISTIKRSDEYTEIGKNFGFLISKTNFIKEIENILDNNLHNNKLEIENINNLRIKEINNLFDKQ